MRTHLMRHFAVAIGFGVCSIAAPNCSAVEQSYAAEGTYQAPSRWSNFNRPSKPIRSTTAKSTSGKPFDAMIQTVAAQQAVEALPAPTAEWTGPVPEVEAAPTMRPAVPAMEMPHAVPSAPYAHEGAAGPYSSPYAAAAGSSWEGEGCQTCSPAPVAGPQPIAPWFGGSSLLFWNVNGGNDNALFSYDNGVTVVRNSDLDPSSHVGFDVHFGRYLACGKYGLDFGYMFWDPGSVSRQAFDGGSGLRYIAPALNTVSINRGGGATTVYADYDTNATRVRATRDMRVQGFEVNLNCFGISGARRLGSCSPSALCGNPFGQSGRHGGKYYGGLTGPLARACSGCVRIQTSHGFRWFQLEDEMEIVGDVDGTPGYASSDLWYDIETENNLFGYQFGGQMAYCLGCRTMLTLGGKMGVYGNDAHFRQQLGTRTILAYTDSQGAGAGDISTDQSDVGVAGLGELDFGIGYRLSNRWTVNGGYRILAACGVATAVGQIPSEFTSAASSGAVRADDCLFLHGAYVGVDYNW